MKSMRFIEISFSLLFLLFSASVSAQRNRGGGSTSGHSSSYSGGSSSSSGRSSYSSGSSYSSSSRSSSSSSGSSYRSSSSSSSGGSFSRDSYSSPSYGSSRSYSSSPSRTSTSSPTGIRNRSYSSGRPVSSASTSRNVSSPSRNTSNTVSHSPARSRNEIAARPVRTSGPRVNVTSHRPGEPKINASRYGNSRIGRTAHRGQHHNDPRMIRRHGHTYYSHIGHHYHPFYYGNCRYYVHCGRYYRWDPYLGYEWIPYPYGWYFSTLPFNCFAVTVGDGYYYYGEGTWFIHNNNGYEVVESPITDDETLTVPELPYECSLVVVNEKTYFVGEGTWFVASDKGYQVVDVPTENATIVESLSDDNKKIEVANTDFFFDDSKWYIPVEGGYMHIDEPIAIQLKNKPEINGETSKASTATENSTATETKAEEAPVTRAATPAPKIELPASAKTVDINGAQYFFANDIWYTKTINGDYIIVESPLK